jgi:Ca-activated chloride channel family protein
MLVLDASGSMQQAVTGGGTRMDAAKAAVHTFVAAAPAEARVGLTVYGTGTGSSDAEKAAGCRDIKVLRSPTTLDRAALDTAVDSIKASGYTPIGASLRAAAAALPKSGPRSIVLVSDGEDTCAPPDPCQVAADLHRQGIDLVVHTVGFGVDDASRKQLTCVAQATGGTYTDAPDAAALERVLPRVSATALRNYQPAGSRITGTAGWSGAPVATPGQYLDTIGQHEKRYWAVDVPAGATTYFSGTVSFPRVPGISETDDINTLAIQVYGTDGADCHQYAAQEATKSSDGVALTITKTWTPPATGSPGCTGGHRYWFAITWDKVSKGVPTRLPIELLAGIEPAASDAGPDAAGTPVTFTTPTGTATAVTGGGSFNVAGTLTGPGSYTDTLQRGEFVFYRVRLGWGQGLAYRVTYAATGNRGIRSLSNERTTLYSPFRQEVASEYSVYTGSGNALPSDGSAAVATVPVRYQNRTGATEYRAESLAGWYYLAVKLGATPDGGDTNAVGVRIDLTVTGGTEAGPHYARSADVFGGASHAPSATGTAAAPRAAADTSPLTTAAWIVIPILVAAGAATTVAVTLVRRRRLRQP